MRVVREGVILSYTYHVELGVIGLQVDTVYEHRGISRRGRDDDLLSTTLQVSARPVAEILVGRYVFP